MTVIGFQRTADEVELAPNDDLSDLTNLPP